MSQKSNMRRAKYAAEQEKNIWLCYDCHKFTCTKCYAKEHKHCWADLIENMYSEMEETNKANLEAIRGMRVVMDLVVNHTSDHHKWFKEALSNPESPYRDYYVFKKGKKDEKGRELPPNNWQSCFTGSAWEKVEGEDNMYYLHLFTKYQPDLNWHNEKVLEEVEKRQCYF